MIEASAINQKLRKHQHMFTGCQAPTEIADNLQKILRPWNVKVRTLRSADIPTQAFSVGGSFDLEIRRNNIEIDLYFSPRQRKLIWFDDKIENFMFLVSQVLQHELIHRYQNSSRPADVQQLATYYNIVTRRERDQSEVDYLSEFDEIDAYAHDIALEIYYYYPGQDALDILRTISKRRKLYSWNMYKRAFRNCDDWSLVKHRLLGKVYRWLPYITF